MKIRKIFIAAALLFYAGISYSQELFISTESASNMPAQSFGIRLGSENFFADHSLKSRTDLDLMYGFSSFLMGHVHAHASNYYGSYGFNNFGIYAKYRLYSDDGFKSHFRIAAFAQASFGPQRNTFADLELQGGNSGLETGLIFTILENRLALSSTLGVIALVPDLHPPLMPAYENIKNYNYSLSAGYLVYPPQYTSYNDINLNLYAELLGKYISFDQNQPGMTMTMPHHATVLDLAVGPQIIINSISRIDLAIRTRLISGVEGFPKPSVYLRLEQMFY